MKRLFMFLTLLIAVVGFGGQSAHAFTSDPHTFISGDNVFYAYVVSGEKVHIDFTESSQVETTGLQKEPVTVTVEAPGVAAKTCNIPANVPVGSGCVFNDLTAAQTGIWRISFQLPKTAHIHSDVASAVHWGANHFTWGISVKDSLGEKKGRVWSELYAIRQPAPASFLANLTLYYESEDGYLYRAIYRGYNGQLSTLSADAFGVVKKGTCTAAYQSVPANNAAMVASLGSCGGSYKLFFEQPSDDLPEEATQWDGQKEWVRPSIDRPIVDGLKFTPDSSTDIQSGTISYDLKNFVGQYEIKIDTNADGNYDSRDDITIKRQIKSLKNAGEQKITFDGMDGQGVAIPRTQHIKIKINISKAAEIHLVGGDIEGREGGIELTRLSGDNAPNSQVCWNDTELRPDTDGLGSKLTLDGRNCPDSTGGVHAWKYSQLEGLTWGNARYIDDWAYASAKVQGTAEIEFPSTPDEAQAVAKKSINIWAVAAIVGIVVAGVVAASVISVKRRHKRQTEKLLSQQQSNTTYQDPNQPGPPWPPRQL